VVEIDRIKSREYRAEIKRERKREGDRKGGRDSKQKDGPRRYFRV
jgi:hypothetical protein